MEVDVELLNELDSLTGASARLEADPEDTITDKTFDQAAFDYVIENGNSKE